MEAHHTPPPRNSPPPGDPPPPPPEGADERMRRYWAGDRAALAAWTGRVYTPGFPRPRPVWRAAPYNGPYRSVRPYRPA